MGTSTLNAYRGGVHQETKKADVVQHPKAFYHVGLLFNEPPGWAELFFV